MTHARTCAAVSLLRNLEQIRLGKNSEQLEEVHRERELLERAYLRHGGRLYKKTRRIPEAERGTLEGPTEAFQLMAKPVLQQNMRCVPGACASRSIRIRMPVNLALLLIGLPFQET